MCTTPWVGWPNVVKGLGQFHDGFSMLESPKTISENYVEGEFNRKWEGSRRELNRANPGCVANALLIEADDLCLNSGTCNVGAARLGSAK